MRRILVTGPLGQIGSELVPALRKHCGEDAVLESYIRMAPAAGEKANFLIAEFASRDLCSR
jgi:nucleoside-diphosphate-sugar epimerase